MDTHRSTARYGPGRAVARTVSPCVAFRPAPEQPCQRVPAAIVNAFCGSYNTFHPSRLCGASRHDVRKRVRAPEHADVDTVCEHIRDRAADPRTDHPDVHLDTTIATVVDRYGDTVVRSVIHHILVDGVRFQTATTDHDVAALDSVQLGLSQRTFSASSRRNPRSSDLNALGRLTSRYPRGMPRSCLRGQGQSRRPRSFCVRQGGRWLA